MSPYGTLPPLPRRRLCVFYVLDTSSSMRGLPISTLNRAMGNSLHVLRQTARENPDSQVEVAVLEYDTTCRWMHPEGPVPIEDFVWTNLRAGGLTCMGAALRELGSKLSRDAWLGSPSGLFAPVVILMTDGYAVDDYEGALAELEGNDLFSAAIRIGFAIGDDPDVDMIARITGSAESVIRTTDLDVFADLLRFVSMRSSTASMGPWRVDGEEGGQAGEVVREAWQSLGRGEEGPAYPDGARTWDIPDL